jgi:hypothetical protein
MINLGSGMGKDRACNTSTDCTVGAGANPQLPDCCTNTTTNQKVCFNKSYTGVINSFKCP